MLIGGIVVGLLLGLWAGGRILNLASIQLRWIWLLFAAVIVRFGTEALLNAGVDLAETLRVPLFATGFGMLLVGLWANRSYPGLSLAFIGILLNAIVILLNGGHMPIWEPSLEAAGFTADDVNSAIHVVVDDDLSAAFLTRALVLGDIFPIPVPIIRNVASLGDIFLSIGLGFFLFASVVRVPTEPDEREEEAVRRRLVGLAGSATLPRGEHRGGIAPETGLAPALYETAALERPLVLGAQGAGMASPALAPLPMAEPEAARPTTGTLPPIAIPRPSPETVARVRQHPYVRLALNGSFSALWAGQLISLFGDRIHQLALAAAVLITTGSVLASALVFMAAFVPNLLFSPIAGTLVDRWDHKEVLIVSDLLRAATVLLIPIAVVVNVVLVFPMVFLLTTISIFFRPARVAILPRIVREDELVTANSALWIGETMADIIGYPLAGLFVVGLGSALPIAFWLDAATYAASAVLLSTIVIRAAGAEGATDDEIGAPESTPEDAGLPAVAPGSAAPEPAMAASVSGGDDVATGVGEGFLAELKAGYRFLRREPTLFANTIQASVAQLTVGVLTALMPAFAITVFGASDIGWEAVYSFIETGVGAGNLLGGFVIGLIGSRLAKGRMIIGGYAVWGLLTFLFAISGNLGLVLGLAFGSGIANMVFLIPSQTLFQERTPPALMGRVVGFRFALVFGAMTFAMGLGGVAGQIIGVVPVIAFFGLVSFGAGVAGWFVPALRDA